MNYRTLEKEVEDRKNKLTAKSWRGDLTTNGLRSVQWGVDLKEIEKESMLQYK